jgi:molybdopterin-guanine dinucleotide biosynthesis protein A
MAASGGPSRPEHRRDEVTAVVLAGGRARRLGGADKSALRVDGGSILDRQLAVLRGLTPHLFIVGHSPERFALSGLRVVPDRVEGAGPLSGLHTALVTATTARVVVLACDMPFVPLALLSHLVDALGPADVSLPRDAHGRHPLCACYHVRCAAHFEAALRAGRYKVGDALAGLQVVETAGATLAALDVEGRALTNVNSAADYEALLSAPAPDAPPTQP